MNASKHIQDLMLVGEMNGWKSAIGLNKTQHRRNEKLEANELVLTFLSCKRKTPN